MRVLLLFLALGCRASAHYDPPAWTQELESEMRFVSARPADPSTAVYSLVEGRFRRVDDRPLWARGRREYVVAIHTLGVVDLETGENRVVFRETQDRVADGNGRFDVADARGGFALVERGRETAQDVLLDPGGWYLLDLAAGALERIDPPLELKALGAELAGAPRLCGDDGAVLYAARPRRSGLALSKPTRWIVRRRSGELVDLGFGRLVGEHGGALYVDRQGGGGLRYDLATGTVSDVELEGFALPDAPPAAQVELAADGRALRVIDPAGGVRAVEVERVAR